MVSLHSNKNLTKDNDNGINLWNCKKAPRWMLTFMIVEMVIVSLHSNKPLTTRPAILKKKEKVQERMFSTFEKSINP